MDKFYLGKRLDCVGGERGELAAMRVRQRPGPLRQAVYMPSRSDSTGKKAPCREYKMTVLNRSSGEGVSPPRHADHPSIESRACHTLNTSESEGSRGQVRVPALPRGHTSAGLFRPASAPCGA